MFDDFAETVRDVQVALDDASFGLDQFEGALLHNTELLSKLQRMYAEVLAEGPNMKSGSDFNQVIDFNCSRYQCVHFSTKGWRS